MSMKIWLARPKFFGLEKQYLQEAIESNWIASVGGKKSDFKEDLARFLNFEGSINLLNSGTSALHTSLIMANIGLGDYVLCSTLTFVASANAIRYVNAEPIFIDSDLDSWNMCPVLLENAIIDLHSKNIFPKAVMLVHVCGIPAKVKEVLAICRKYNILLIEDAAGALGSSVENKKLGTYGDFGIISLNGNKVVTGASGGILLSQKKENESKIENLITQAKSNENPYEHKIVGYNYAMTNVSVAIARAQLVFVDTILEEKKALYDRYKVALGASSFIQLKAEMIQNHWISTVLFKEEEEKNKVFFRLKEEGIESRFMWKPMHLQELYSNLNGTAELLFKQSLCLPSDINMTEEEQSEVIKMLLETV
jgi:dTDP-4-amino-4,6-dideoxygalactose transaminase